MNYYKYSNVGVAIGLVWALCVLLTPVLLCIWLIRDLLA